MVDQVLRPMNDSPPSRRHGRPATALAAALAAALLSSMGGSALAATTGTAGTTAGTAGISSSPAGVTVQVRQASGTPGDEILDKPGAIGESARPLATKTPSSRDFLDGLALDVTREAVIDAASESGSGMTLRPRGAATGKGTGPEATGSETTGSEATGPASTDPAATGPATGISPVYVDGAGNPRALPGGVIVIFREPVDADTARTIIEASGHQALREIAARMWLVGTDSGDAALEAARRLASDGRFESVEPNWWRAPVRK